MRSLHRSLSFFVVTAAVAAAAAGIAPGPAAAQTTFDTLAIEGLHYRMVGPVRGGRSTAVGGFPDDPDRWIMGSTGGGVWVSDDNGAHWTNITDGFFGGSVGAVRVAPSDPNVIYVGMGSADIRGNTSHGRGVWKSTDGGRSWSFIG
ncbi:MAG: glycosyl hydrolase, partial [Gemmatimonadota bacterium]